MGSYATVKVALHRTEGVKYAVKLLGEKHSDAVLNARRRLERSRGAGSTGSSTFKVELGREVEILKTLQHEYVVRYKEHFVEDDDITTSMTPRLNLYGSSC